MEKFILPPNQDGYGIQGGNEVVSVTLEGGLSRSRRDVIGATDALSCSWDLGPQEYEYFNAFYNGVAKKGAIPFLIDLLLDLPTLTEHIVKFVPGTKRLSEQRGLTYIVSAQLEVIPTNDEDFDESYAMLVSEYGFDGALPLINQLEYLVNVQLPDASP